MNPYTPGPWEAIELDDGSYGIISERIPPHLLAVFGDIAAVWKHGKGTRTAGNARLIAAAPDLLDALVRARRCLAWASEQRPEFVAEYEAADAAITKARQI